MTKMAKIFGISCDQLNRLRTVRRVSQSGHTSTIPSLLCVSLMKLSPLIVLRYSHPGLQRTCSVHTSSVTTQCFRPTPQ